MQSKRFVKLVALVLGSVIAFGSGRCLPNDYWSAFLGDTVSSAVGQVLEDFISDAVDAVDPALEVNQI